MRAFILSLLLTTTASATVRVVNPDGSGEWPTIQAAIDASVDGDEVVLTAGVYFGHGNRDLQIDRRAITLRSVTGNPADVTLDPNANTKGELHRAMLLEDGEGPYTVVQGLTVYCGRVSEGPPNLGSVNIQNSSPTFRDCVFTRADGTAVYSRGGAPTFERCDWLDNWCISCVPALNADAATLLDCTMSGNGNDDTIGTATIGKATMRNCVIDDSSTYMWCGALSIGPGSTLEDTSISGWALESGSALCVTGPAILRRCTIATAGAGAPALGATGGCVVLQDCVVIPEYTGGGCVLRVKAHQPPSGMAATLDVATWGRIKAGYR